MNISGLKNKEQNENINIFTNIKSKYVLKKLFEYLPQKKLLQISKYNKELQNILNIGVKDYKDYLKIEIEIIPVKSVENIYNKTFINFSHDESYYHIFFNDKKEEIKRNYYTEDDKVTKIKVFIDYEINSLSGLFSLCTCIKSVNFIKFTRNKIINLNSIFYKCSSLKELNLSNFNTNKVTDMGSMFYGCRSLKELNLSKFNTNNVTNMRYMFYGCSSLKELNLSNFNTSNVTDMNCMFSGCS